MTQKRIALITGANQGMGKQLATELVSDGTTVFLGSRDLARGEAAAAEIGEGAIALQLDVTYATSIAAAVARVGAEAGRLHLLVNNAGVATTRTGVRDLAEFRAASTASRVSLDDVRAVWEVNVFAPLAMYQAALPLLLASPAARIINVTSALGSLNMAADPTSPYRSAFDPAYAASKAALNALTLTMMIELEGSGIAVNLVSPGFAKTALVNFEGTDTIEDAVREVVRVARSEPLTSSGVITTWPNTPIPW